MDNQNFAFKTITKFDGFGATVNLQIFGDKNDKNLLGAAISIGMLALSIALSFSTFLEFVNGTNPTISSSVEYSTQNLTINYTNFFFGISFFEPYRDVRSLDSSANNLPAIKFINQLNISCTTCEGEYLNSDAIMNLCNPDQFNNISIKSMSAAKSKGVNSIFSAYSFCFPQELKSVIKDNNEENSLQESSLQLFIPVNNVSIEFTAVKQNLAPQPGADTLTSKISSSTSTNVAAQAPVPQPDYAPAPVQNPTAPQQQPQSGPAGGGMQQPTQGQMSPTGSGTQMQGPTGGSTSQQKPGGTTGGMSNFFIEFFFFFYYKCVDFDFF